MTARLLVLSVLPLLLIAPFGWGDDTEPRQRDVRLAVSDEARLSEILDKWQAAFADVHTARTTFLRYEYDSVFLIERRSEGEFRYQAPDRIYLNIKSVTLTETTNPHQVSAGEEPYALESEEPVTLYLDRHELILAYHDDKTYDYFQTPPHMRDVTIALIDPLMEMSPETAYVREEGFWQDLFAPLAFMIGVRDGFYRLGSFLCGYEVDRLREEFEWTIERDTAEEIRLSARPLTEITARNISHVDIILDPETYRPSAVRIIDPRGNKETVFVVRDILVNDPDCRVSPPRLAGYKLLQTTTADEPNSEPGTSTSMKIILCGALLVLLISQSF